MEARNREIFLAHAMKALPMEACGLLVVLHGKEHLVLCHNLSDRRGEFTIDPKDYRSAAELGDIIGVVHSHCFTPPTPSDADLAACEATNVPWVICSVPNATWFEFNPSGYRAPLVGRSWAHGVHDCYNLACDYYREKFGAELPHFHREYEWFKKGFDLYCRENWERAGFTEIDLSDLQEHDAILMQMHSPVINHVGIYLGNNLMLHQMTHRLSTRDIYSGYFQRHTVRALRFGGVK
jgi:proteasome lid subunit RPN8/RPN11